MKMVQMRREALMLESEKPNTANWYREEFRASRLNVGRDIKKSIKKWK